jgi:hypothetical protein
MSDAMSTSAPRFAAASSMPKDSSVSCAIFFAVSILIVLSLANFLSSFIYF